MKAMKIAAAILLVALLAWGAIAAHKKLVAPQQYKETRFMMDTVIEITAYGGNAATAVPKVMAEFQRIQNLTNQFDENSQVAQINRLAGEEPVAVDKTLMEMLKRANANSVKLNGALDVTVGVLTNLWGVGRKGDFVPEQAQIDTLLPFVDYKLLKIDETKNTVYLPQKGMRIDLGAVAKEYATYRAVQILKEAGINSALINAGGDIRVIGLRPDGNPWRIGVQDPRQSDGIRAKIDLTEWDSLETSGDYQRFFEKDGVRYSHILDPKTGKQPREVTSVTVVSNSAADNYMLATALFVLGVEKGQEVLKKFPGAEAIWVTNDNKTVITPGLAGKVEITP
ncbi:MAG: FAD:protein FMN transferase [Sporomusaceae bacterium]|jgi:thiamine biosynthesis lipoprotein|nr:FAD:protein FMN transferase [Sporomusaceae bacterium]